MQWNSRDSRASSPRHLDVASFKGAGSDGIGFDPLDQPEQPPPDRVDAALSLHLQYSGFPRALCLGRPQSEQGLDDLGELIDGAPVGRDVVVVRVALRDPRRHDDHEPLQQPVIGQAVDQLPTLAGWIWPTGTADQFSTNILPRITRSMRRGPPS